MKITIGQIIQARTAINKLYHAELPACVVLKVRRLLKPFIAEINTFEDTKNEYIKTHGTNNEIKQGTLEFDIANIYILEMTLGEVDISIDVLDQTTLGEVKLSVADIDNLINVGLLKDE